MRALGCVGYLASVWTVVRLYLGFDVTNEPFGEHARFYRDALVHAMDRNAPACVMPDGRFPLAFYENALGFAENNLSREDLIGTPLFENPDLLRNVDPKRRLDRMHHRIPLFNRPVDVFGICFVVFWL